MRSRLLHWPLVAAMVCTLPLASAQISVRSSEAQRLSKVIEALQTGATRYPDTDLPMAEALAQQAPVLNKTLTRLGKLESIDLLRTQQGERVYEVWFLNGRTIWGVTESPAGRIAGMRVELRQYR